MAAAKTRWAEKNKLRHPSRIAAYITDLLYRNGINIVNAFLGYEEIILILDESDGPRAYTTLEEETGKGRK